MGYCSPILESAVLGLVMIQPVRQSLTLNQGQHTSKDSIDGTEKSYDEYMLASSRTPEQHHQHLPTKTFPPVQG
jgi:hypothetical protein